MTSLRVAVSGSSGTGKTTIAKFIAEAYNLPMNPVGSRSVAAAMGFASPYDVDKAGRRAEFQKRLVEEKVAWELAHESFVSDRSTLDNLAYSVIHAVHSIDAKALWRHVDGASRYTHVFYCPVSAFCDVGDDPARILDATYQAVYDTVLHGFLVRYLLRDRLIVLGGGEREQRRAQVRSVLGDAGGADDRGWLLRFFGENRASEIAEEVRRMRARWPSLEIRVSGARDVRYDVYYAGLAIPFGSVARESDGAWWWMTPACGFPGREPQAPPGHKDRFGIRKEGMAPNAESAMTALVGNMWGFSAEAKVWRERSTQAR